MTCKEKILSNDYADIVTDFRLPEDMRISLPDVCRVPLQGEFAINYAERAGLPDINVVEYFYHFIPQCYGLMLDAGFGRGRESFDILPLIDSGIRQVQRPPLSLTGKGVVMAFIDTGAGVYKMQREEAAETVGLMPEESVSESSKLNITMVQGVSWMQIVSGKSLFNAVILE